MPIIKRLSSSYIISTKYNTFLFDYPDDISIPPLVDTIFISNSSSLSILYIDQDIPIYISHPVYTQLLYKHKLEEKNNPKLKDISDTFIKNVVFVSYNQILKFNTMDITVLSSGLYLGWCMYKLDESILYFSDVSFINKVCKKIKLCDVKYILWGNKDLIKIDKSSNDAVMSQKKINGKYVSNSNIVDNINEFNKHILDSTSTTLYVEFPNQLIDLLFHLNYILSKATKTFVIDCPDIRRYLNMCVAESDWLNDKYYKITNIPIKSEGKSNILIKNMPIGESGYVKIEDKDYKLDTRSNKDEIVLNMKGELLDTQEGVYYTLEDKNYEDVMVDGQINVINDWGYVIGECTNTDDKDIYTKVLKISKKEDVIEYLFKNEKFVSVDKVFYFMRIGVKVYEEEGMYKVLRI
jgi:hypothetical protein